jgi:hypothetical protein
MQIKNEKIIKFLRDWKELLNTQNPDLVTLFMAMVNTKELLNIDCLAIVSILKEKGYETKALREATFVDKMKEATDRFIGMSSITGSKVDKVNWLEFCNTYLSNYCGLNAQEAIEAINNNSKYLKARIQGQDIIIDIN